MTLPSERDGSSCVFFRVSVSETMAARGHVNGRGPRRRRGRDSAKRVVSDTDTLKNTHEEPSLLRTFL